MVRKLSNLEEGTNKEVIAKKLKKESEKYFKEEVELELLREKRLANIKRKASK